MEISSRALNFSLYFIHSHKPVIRGSDSGEGGDGRNSEQKQDGGPPAHTLYSKLVFSSRKIKRWPSNGLPCLHFAKSHEVLLEVHL